MRKEEPTAEQSASQKDAAQSSSAPIPLPPAFQTFGSDVDTSDQDTPTLKGKTLPYQKSGMVSTSKFPEIPGYRVIRILGQGGMGAVYLAEEETLQRQVALKIVAQGMSGSQALRNRFESEVKALASLQHPNIAQLFSAGQHNQTPYFVMEFVDGPTLDEFAKTPMGAKAAAKFMTLLCDAMEYCHQQGMLHRDLKPSNILLTQDHQPKIADFGLAKTINSDSSSTNTGEILGTPGYMAPEQASGVVKNMDARCDVYGLGAILFRILTGRAPFVAAEPFQAVMMVLADDPIRPRKLAPNIPSDLETICLKCLEKKADHRYASASELKDDLNRFLEERPINARSTSLFRKSVKWIKRNPTASVATFSILLAVAGAISGLVIHNSALSQELERSNRLADRGSEFAKWITGEHLHSLDQIAGTTKPRGALVEQVKEFLNDSYDDMPSDSKYTSRLGSTYAQLAANIGGSGHNTLGLLDEAKTNFLTAIKLYDQAITDSDNKGTVHRLKIDALLELTEIYRKLDQPDERDKVFQQACELIEELDADSAETVFIEIQIIDKKIDRLMEANQHEAALKGLDELEALLTKLNLTDLGADPILMRTEIVHQEIFVASNRGLCQEFIGNLEIAEEHFRETVRLSKQIFESDLENVLYSKRTSTTLIQLADCLFAQVKVEKALEIYRDALEISRELAAKDVYSVGAKLDLATKLSRVASAQQYLGGFKEGETAISEAIKIHKTLRKKKHQDINIDRGLMIYLQTKATLCMLQSEIDRAAKHFEEHRNICDEKLSADPNDGFTLNQIAESELTHALMLISQWMSQEIDPATVRESEVYKDIKRHLKAAKETYLRIAEIMPLNYHQENQQQRVQETDDIVEQAVNEIIKALQNSDSTTSTSS